MVVPFPCSSAAGGKGRAARFQRDLGNLTKEATQVGLVQLSAVIGVALLFDGLTAGSVASDDYRPRRSSCLQLRRRHQRACLHHRRTGWSALVYQPGQQGESWFDRADHSRGKVTIYTGGGIDAPAGITVGPDGALWLPIPQATRSAGSPRAARSATTPPRAWPIRLGSRTAPTMCSGSPTRTTPARWAW